jgi:hypothetical protein
MPESVVTRPTEGSIRVAVSNSAAFGGSNAVVAVRRGTVAVPARRHPVYWLGAAACGRHGRGDPFVAELPPFSLPSLAGIRVDPWTLDPAGTLMTRAVADALADAGRTGRTSPS